jgi:hypothetical protein
MKESIHQCGVCDRWTHHGDFLPSGNRDARGRTPCDNFVCRRCQQKARDEAAVREAIKLWEQRQAA